MANVQHSALSDPDLHEPKGISTANVDQIYLSDGSGSGAWTNAKRLPGTGWGQYGNTTYVSTTYLAISTTAVLLPFNSNVNVSQLPITYAGATSPLMDLATETLLFVSEGDMHSITIAFQVATTSGSPTLIDLTMYTSTDGITYATLVGENSLPVLKNTAQFFNTSFLFPVSANMADHGCTIKLKTDTGTVNIKDINLISTRVHKAR